MSRRMLRAQLIRLATQDPQLRPGIVRVLRANGGLSYREEKQMKKAVQNQTVIQQPPIVIQQPPIVVNQEALPAAPPVPAYPVGGPVPLPTPVPLAAPVIPEIPPNSSSLGVPEAAAAVGVISVIGVPERTSKGFEHELRGELERLAATGVSRVLAAQQVLAALNTAFSAKDMLYNILIRYQSSFENDLEFKRSLESLTEAWATSNSGV